jgi:hypothetical protein
MKWIFSIAIGLIFSSSLYSQSGSAYTVFTFQDSLQFQVWYPDAHGKAGSYQNYIQQTRIEHLSSEAEPDINRYLNAYLGFVFGHTIEPQKISSIPTESRLGVKKPDNQYPLVIYAPGYRGLPFENSLLCEKLASTGRIVVSVPALGADGKTDSSGLETQIRYIEQAMEFGIKQGYADLHDISLIGFSWGGLSSILAAMRNKSIKCVVSLDGSIRFFYSLAEKMPGFSPDEFDRPVLLFAAEGNDDVDFQFFNKLNKAPAYLVKMTGFTHPDFMAYRFLETPYKDYQKALGYNQMIVAINEFLDAVHSGNAMGKDQFTRKLKPHVVYNKP